MEQQHRKVYETTFIVNATLDDAQIDQVIDRFKEFIGKQSGEVTSLEKWGRKRLAYPIQKKNNGFYCVSEFTAPADAIVKLERYYSLDENVMRFLTIQLTEKMLKARTEQAKLNERSEAAQAEQKAAPKPAPSPGTQPKETTPGS